MKRLFAAILVICLVLSLGTSAEAADSRQHNYSTYANSGVRHEVCTSLLGTSVSSYYTGSYTYENLSSLGSGDLLTALRTLMTSTHTTTTSYNDCHYKAVRTDCENGDGTTISLLYTSYTATESDWINNNTNGWNREHVWPQSLGNFKTTGPGADLHHIRPSDYMVNDLRGNRKYGYVTGGSNAMAVITSGLSGGTYNSTYFEPLDNVKGDVARIILYMYVRYGGDSRYSCSSVTKVFQSVDVLLEWCALDPVDTWEMGRNEVVAAIQGNRNVFIDYPELAWQLFGKTAPADLVTPSGGTTVSTACTHGSLILCNVSAATCTAEGYTGDTCCEYCGKVIQYGAVIRATGHTNANGDRQCDSCGAAVSCQHGSTTIRGAKAATCNASGYSGDECCTDCGETVKSGSVIPATGHRQTLSRAVREACDEDGYTGDVICSECGELLEYGTVIPATGAHTFGDWRIIKDATSTEEGVMERSCTACGKTETQAISVTDESEPATQPTESSAAEDTAAPETDTSPTQTTVAADGAPDTDERSDSWILIAVIIVAACAAGVIAFALAGKRTKSGKQED